MTSSASRKPQPASKSQGQLEAAIEKTMLAARWILIVFYFGLAFALALYAVSFIYKCIKLTTSYKCIKLTTSLFTLSDNEVILAMLGLIDACLVASLMVMVMLTGYENYVSKLDSHPTGD